jgi:SAM-dependent methyltransferase
MSCVSTDGCGTGLVGLALANRLASLVAADSSPGMLEILNTKISEQGIKNVFPQHLDLHHDDCEQDFDLIFSAMTLHHLADLDCILAKLFHCLKTGGIIALADLDEEDGSFHQDNPEGVMHHGFNREKLAGNLKRLGFSSVYVNTVHTIRRKNSQGDEKPYPRRSLNLRHSLNLRLTGKILLSPAPFIVGVNQTCW